MRHKKAAAWTPAADADWNWDRYLADDTGKPAGAHPTTTSRKPFLIEGVLFELKTHSLRKMGGNLRGFWTKKDHTVSGAASFGTIIQVLFHKIKACLWLKSTVNALITR